MVTFIIPLKTVVPGVQVMAKSWRAALKKNGSTNANANANPFELKFNKQKFEILNGNGKAQPHRAAVGRPGASRRKAEEVRKRTLLREYKGLGRTSKVVDRRIVKDADGDVDDATAATRFAWDRSRAKKNMYQLSDDDSDNEQLTHGGRSLTVENMNDFIDPEDDAEGVDGVDLDDGKDHFGGFEEPAKSKAEVMHELISKSKFYKLERQRIKEENESLRGDLDANFDVIRKSLLVDSNRRKTELTEDVAADDNDGFESAVRMLAFDKRQAAQSHSQKTKMELELDQELRRRQEANKRMSGDVENEVDDDAKSQELSRRLQAAEISLGALVDQFCKGTSTNTCNDLYSQAIEGLDRSQHRQILLGRVCRERLKQILDKFSKKMLRGTATVANAGPILLLCLIGAIYSTSDWHHLVATPAQLLGLMLLDYGRVYRVKHLVYSLWICETLLSYQAMSKRYLPEVMNFLYSATAHLARVQIPKDGGGGGYFLVKPMSLKFGGELEYSVDNLLSRPDQISRESAINASSRIVLLAADLYSDLDAFIEIFSPFMMTPPLLEPSSLCKLRGLIAAAESSRNSLCLHNHKPIPLPQLEPYIEDESRADRKHINRDRPGRDEIQRLRTRVKKEMRGAQRELRKDSRFLAREQLSAQKVKDAEYQANIARLYGTLGNENDLK